MPVSQPLSGELTIGAAATQHGLLLTALSAGSGDLLLDLSAIESCDSAGLQLLMATARSLRARGDRIQLQHPSSAVAQALQTYGLDTRLQPVEEAQP